MVKVKNDDSLMENYKLLLTLVEEGVILSKEDNQKNIVKPKVI